MKGPVLIVEDDVALKGQIIFYLKSHVKEIYEASTVEDALTYINKVKFDVILLDLGLPPSENSPEEGMRLLSYLDENTKIIVITGQDEQDTVKKAIKYGVFDYLIKPLDPVIILNAIKRAYLFLKAEDAIKDEENLEKIQIFYEQDKGLQQAREAVERGVLEKVLKETNFNIYKAAKRLGLKRQSVYYFIKKFNIKRF